MTEAEWLRCEDPRPMLRQIRAIQNERKFRLFACACCRRIWDLLATACSRRAVEVAEKFADGLVSEDERLAAFADAIQEANGWANTCGFIDAAYGGGTFAAAFSAARQGTVENTGNAAVIASEDLSDFSQAPMLVAAFHACSGAAAATGAWVRIYQDGELEEHPQEWEKATLAVGRTHAVSVGAAVVTQQTDATEVAELVRAAEDTAQCDLVRDIFGNPFRAVAFDPRWQSETVVALASGIYAERAFDRMPILADALEEAGCDHADILAHCRGDGPHVRGCWVVDLILGKS